MQVSFYFAYFNGFYHLALVVSPTVPVHQNLIINNMDHTLTCDFIGYPLPTNVEWTFNDKPVNFVIFNASQEQNTIDEKIVRSSITFKPHSIAFSGNYTCIANNNYTMANFSYKVAMQGVYM